MVERPVVAIYFWGTGRRKSAVARVRLRPGKGKIIVNKRELENYFPIFRLQEVVRQPLKVTKMMDKYDALINVRGGGIAGQADACSLGIARALIKADPSLQPILKDEGLLTRDPREKERKKYGLAGARRGYQFSKR